MLIASPPDPPMVGNVGFPVPMYCNANYHTHSNFSAQCLSVMLQLTKCGATLDRSGCWSNRTV
jgi:hypothetical protein